MDSYILSLIIILWGVESKKKNNQNPTYTHLKLGMIKEEHTFTGWFSKILDLRGLSHSLGLKIY